MTKVLESLEIVDVEGKESFQCAKCKTVLCPVTEDYKNYALKNEAPISKGEPDYLVFDTDRFVLMEYYCPQCAVMFEVDMVEKGEEQIHSIQLKK
jgi:acetone carboxylase gamma subunit